MPRSMILAVLLAIGGHVSIALAQDSDSRLPHAAPLHTMERARSYSLLNRSSDVIVAAHARMTNGDERDLTWNEPLRPEQGRTLALPSTDCLAELTVRFKSGRALQTRAPDCRQTRIIATDSSLQIGSDASDRPPIN